MRMYFMQTERIGFSTWSKDDVEYAKQLWGDPAVTKLICAKGSFTQEEISNRLTLEILNQQEHAIQYWPIFERATGDLIGCCGARPFGSLRNSYEIGFHLRKEYWGKGYAKEAAQAVIDHCFTKLSAQKLFAGHHPQNIASKKLLTHLGFYCIGDNYYEPTGLYHPSYELLNPTK